MGIKVTKKTGQARKSLWIETATSSTCRAVAAVRLVRACGSKRQSVLSYRVSHAGQARKSLWIETAYRNINLTVAVGQARKSLWIETYPLIFRCSSRFGQARKSLWIETHSKHSILYSSVVRLVRACGSKLSPIFKSPQLADGQARKSLWIETLRADGNIVTGELVRLVRACGSKLRFDRSILSRLRSGS